MIEGSLIIVSKAWGKTVFKIIVTHQGIGSVAILSKSSSYFQSKGIFRASKFFRVFLLRFVLKEDVGHVPHVTCELTNTHPCVTVVCPWYSADT